jgi:LysR family transcriptional regulator, regulator for bpeEF and oprC
MPGENNMEPIEKTRLFINVIQSKSFTKAALSLKLPKSTVSRAISSLEDETGTKLIVRTTRSLSLTPAGQAYFDTCSPLVHGLEDAHKSLFGSDTMMNGHVRITAPEDLGNFVVAPAIAKLSINHPKLHFELHLTNETIDLVRDGYDIAVRLGRLSQSTHKVRKLGTVKLILVASPQYLKKCGPIKSIHDVSHHPTLSLAHTSLTSQWIVQSKGKTERIKVQPHFTANNMTSVLEMAKRGAGIALVPQYLAQPSIEAGQVTALFLSWQQNQFPASLVAPSQSAKIARVRLCLDTLSQEITKALV